MKKIIPLILVVFGLCCLVNCSQSKTTEILYEVETLIESHPDSAFNILLSIDQEQLGPEDEKAKYALLMEMARYKNMIDDTTFTFLQPAIEYYINQNKGTPNEKVKTYFYQGTIHRLGNRYSDASDSYSKGLSLLETGEATDTLFWCRLLEDQGQIFYKIFYFGNDIDCKIKASQLYGCIGQHDQEYHSLIKAYGVAMVGQFKDRTDSIRNICQQMADTTGWKLKLLYRNDMGYAQIFGPIENLDLAVGNFIAQGDLGSEDYYHLAMAYFNSKEFDKGFEMLDKVLACDSTESKGLKYLTTLAYGYKAAGRYKEASEVMSKYIKVYVKENEDRFDSERERIDKLHIADLDRLRQDHKNREIRILALSTVCVLLLVILVIFQRMRAKSTELATLKALTLQLETERDNLNNVIKTLREKEVDDNTSNIIRQRLEAINAFLAAEIGDKDIFTKKGSKLVKSLTNDKDKFMDSLRISYEASHPKFIQYLKEHGLTQWEINYSCLYLIGLRGKEIGTYLQMRSHYNISSEIRTKLGLENKSTNLGIYLRKLLEEMENHGA